MSASAFFDTNVLLYMYDRRDPRKRLRAIELFASCSEDQSLVISTQVVQEFYYAATRKFEVSPSGARRLVSSLFELRLVTVEKSHILRALDLEARYRFSFWDALILSAAESAGARTLYSEDFTHGQRVAGVEVVNPFAGA